MRKLSFKFAVADYRHSYSEIQNQVAFLFQKTKKPKLQEYPKSVIKTTLKDGYKDALVYKVPYFYKFFKKAKLLDFAKANYSHFSVTELLESESNQVPKKKFSLKENTLAALVTENKAFIETFKENTYEIQSFEEFTTACACYIKYSLQIEEKETWLIQEGHKLMRTVNPDLDAISEGFFVMSSYCIFCYKLYEVFEVLVLNNLESMKGNQFLNFLGGLSNILELIGLHESKLAKVRKAIQNLEPQAFTYEELAQLAYWTEKARMPMPQALLSKLENEYEDSFSLETKHWILYAYLPKKQHNLTKRILGSLDLENNTQVSAKILFLLETYKLQPEFAQSLRQFLVNQEVNNFSETVQLLNLLFVRYDSNIMKKCENALQQQITNLTFRQFIELTKILGKLSNHKIKLSKKTLELIKQKALESSEFFDFVTIVELAHFFEYVEPDLEVHKIISDYILEHNQPKVYSSEYPLKDKSLMFYKEGNQYVILQNKALGRLNINGILVLCNSMLYSSRMKPELRAVIEEYLRAIIQNQLHKLKMKHKSKTLLSLSLKSNFNKALVEEYLEKLQKLKLKINAPGTAITLVTASNNLKNLGVNTNLLDNLF